MVKDSGQILESIRVLPMQFSQAWEEVNALEYLPGVSACQNVVICGMGGSALGGRIVDSLTYGRARTPIEVYTEYNIPNYVGPLTFIILSSYSGYTEETLSAAEQALAKKAKIFGITTGGNLAEFLNENSLPGYIFDPKNNPSKQPRMGLGYSVGSILAILSRYGFIQWEDKVSEITQTLKDFIKRYDEENNDLNIAKYIAKKLKGKIPILFASEHLLGITHAFSNQVNENSKTFSAHFDIPEANHHLMEGLGFPKKARELLTFFFIESNKYSPEVIKRYPITAEVIEKNGYPTLSYQTLSEDKYCEIFEILVLCSFISYYLAMENDIDPTPIPWVDYFKEKLSRKRNNPILG